MQHKIIKKNNVNNPEPLIGARDNEVLEFPIARPAPSVEYVENLLKHLEKWRIRLWDQSLLIKPIPDKRIRDCRLKLNNDLIRLEDKLKSLIKLDHNNIYPFPKNFYTRIIQTVIQNVNHEPTLENIGAIQELVTFIPKNQYKAKYDTLKGILLGIAAVLFVLTTAAIFKFGLLPSFHTTLKDFGWGGAMGGFIALSVISMQESISFFKPKPQSPVNQLQDITYDLVELKTLRNN